MKDKLMNLIGKRVTLFTKQNPVTGKSFRFEGEINDFDGKFLEIFDLTTNKLKMVSIESIMEIEFSR